MKPKPIYSGGSERAVRVEVTIRGRRTMEWLPARWARIGMRIRSTNNNGTSLMVVRRVVG